MKGRGRAVRVTSWEHWEVGCHHSFLLVTLSDLHPLCFSSVQGSVSALPEFYLILFPFPVQSCPFSLGQPPSNTMPTCPESLVVSRLTAPWSSHLDVPPQLNTFSSSPPPRPIHYTGCSLSILRLHTQSNLRLRPQTFPDPPPATGSESHQVTENQGDACPLARVGHLSRPGHSSPLPQDSGLWAGCGDWKQAATRRGHGSLQQQLPERPLLPSHAPRAATASVSTRSQFLTFPFDSVQDKNPFLLKLAGFGFVTCNTRALTSRDCDGGTASGGTWWDGISFMDSCEL